MISFNCGIQNKTKTRQYQMTSNMNLDYKTENIKSQEEWVKAIYKFSYQRDIDKNLENFGDEKLR